MIEAKPVAEITIYGDIAGIATKENFNNYPSGTLLFTADQLKAEREKAIKECAEIADLYHDAEDNPSQDIKLTILSKL
jgi:hypothetical protein